MPDFRLDMGETNPGRRAGNANQMLARRTLNLTPCVARVALQRLIAVRTVEFEFGVVHGLHLIHAQSNPQKSEEKFCILFLLQLRM